MSDYISREAALEALCADCCAKECDKGLCQDYHNISVLPSADVRPKWKSVREYTPEPGRYLTACKSMTNPPSCYLRILSYTDNLESVDEYDFEGENIPGWYEYDSEYGHYSCDNVEWFMPLPEPPNCGEKREES